MKRNEIWEDFASLPEEAQKEVADFIAFLRARYQKPSSRKRSVKKNLTEEAFIGIWRDRPEMENSSQWVRNLRHREWTN